MSLSKLSPSAMTIPFSRFVHSLFRRRLGRRLVCFAIIVNLLIWPGGHLSIEPIPAVASAAINVTTDSLRYVSLLFKWLFGSTAPAGVPRQETMADRIARVNSIRLSPHKYSGYVGDTVTFVALGVDGASQPVHGAKFSWESSNAKKLEIDEAGRARLLEPGLVRVTCRAGTIERTAPVLIGPGGRRLQTDGQWKADQDSLDSSTTGTTGNGGATSAERFVSAVLDKLAPTASAAGESPGDWGNDGLIGQVGTPPYAALEGTRLGPVMPGTNFNLAIPLVNLGGRGPAASLNLYYNSNVWGARFDPSLNTLVWTFDPIQGWPGPGFSLGFGRIIYYDSEAYYNPNNPLESGHKYMLIDPDGTRHYLGLGTDYGNNTLQTTDGSRITFVGNAANGGTLYYNDGTAVAIGKINNRLLPSQITDTNGNYIQIAYKWETNFPGIALNYIVDTLGRVISFNYGEWPAQNSTDLTSISSPVGTVSFGHQSVTMNYDFQNAAVANAPANFSAVTSVTNAVGLQHQFTYSGYGMVYSSSVISGSSTATVSYDYPLGGEPLWGGPTFTQRTESPNAVYSYSTLD